MSAHLSPARINFTLSNVVRLLGQQDPGFPGDVRVAKKAAASTRAAAE